MENERRDASDEMTGDEIDQRRQSSATQGGAPWTELSDDHSSGCESNRDQDETRRAPPQRLESPSPQPSPTPRTESLRIRRFTMRLLLGLFILACIFALRIGDDLIMPIVLAVLLAILLSPVMRTLNRLGVPNAVGAFLVLASLSVLTAYGAYRLAVPATEWLDRAPETFAEVEEKFGALRRPFQRLTEATEQVTELTESRDEEEPFATTVQVDESPTLADALVEQARGTIIVTVLVIILLYFLLASGDLFLHKLVHVLPTLSDKKWAVEIVNSIKRDMSVYLLTITLINIGLGVVIGFAMYLLGMPNPVLWGVMGAALNFVPYLGAVVGVVVIAIVAAVTYDEPARVLLIPVVYFALTTAEGYFVTPLVLGVRLTLNPVVIFIALMFWSWMWGIPGALLAVPLLAAFKILCDRIERLKPIGEFLSR